MNAWNTGFTGAVKVTNTGTATLDGWSLTFTLPAGQTVTSAWNAVVSPPAGRVTAGNVSYNRILAPGASADFGFQATHTGDTARPPAFALNGVACAAADSGGPGPRDGAGAAGWTPPPGRPHAGGVNEDLERGPGGDLMAIGRFARLCRLSVKQLRNYADLGLLAPAWVDPDTGYRYYRAGQAREALSIGLLRSLDVPLAVIGEVLSGAAAAQALGRVRDDLEAELARRRRTLATLERVLDGGIPGAPVDVVSEPARRVVLARDVAIGAKDIGRAVSACVARLTAALHDGGGDPGTAAPIGPGAGSASSAAVGSAGPGAGSAPGDRPARPG
nr:hypothetical protein GCM10020093_022140 [Planobispora longispora]